jgi:hypothetical protein
VEYSRIAEPMLVVRFPDGGSLSIEFTDQASDDDHPRLGAWLELRVEDPAAVMRAAVDAGLPQVEHPATRTISWRPEARSSRSRHCTDADRDQCEG